MTPTIFRLTLLAVLATTSVEAQATGAPAPFVVPNTVHVSEDVVYREGPTGPLHSDIYAPLDTTNAHPGVVFLFGGGFVSGTKKLMTRHASYMADHGFVAMAIDYGLAPASHFPVALNDAQGAVKWMRAHARALHVDPTRIGVVGMSSGGYVAAALATNEWSGRDWSGAPADARVQGAVLFNPVLDLASLAAGSMPEPLEQFMGVAFATDSARWKDASPLRHLGPSAAPSLYLHGRNDELVPYTQSVEAQHRLAAAGVRAEIFVADSAGHGFFTRPQWREPMLARMSDFLSAVLKSSAP